MNRTDIPADAFVRALKFVKPAMHAAHTASHAGVNFDWGPHGIQAAATDGQRLHVSRVAEIAAPGDPIAFAISSKHVAALLKTPARKCDQRNKTVTFDFGRRLLFAKNETYSGEEAWNWRHVVPREPRLRAIVYAEPLLAFAESAATFRPWAHVRFAREGEQVHLETWRAVGEYPNATNIVTRAKLASAILSDLAAADWQEGFQSKFIVDAVEALGVPKGEAITVTQAQAGGAAIFRRTLGPDGDFACIMPIRTTSAPNEDAPNSNAPAIRRGEPFEPVQLDKVG